MTQSLPNDPPPGSWRGAIRGNVLAMGLVSFFTDASSEMIFPLLPVFFTGLVPLALAPLYLGLMEGIAETTASLLKIVSGRLSDRLGKRKALVLLGYGLSTISRPLIGFAAAGWHVIAMRFVDRIGKGVRTSPRDALISDSVDREHRGLAFSFHRAMDHAGAVVGPLAAFLILLGLVGWANLWTEEARATPAEMSALRTLFWISLIPGLLAMAALAFLVREVRPGGAPAESPVTKTPGDAKAESPAGEAARHDRLPRRFYYFIGVVTLFALGNSTDLFLLLYGKERFGLGILQLLAAWVALHLAKIIFSIPGGILSDRLGRRPLIVAGWLIYAVIYLGMALAGEPWQYWTLFIIYGSYYGLSEGAEKALVADFVPSRQRGRAYGLYSGAIGLAALPASLLFGLVWMALENAYPGTNLGPRVAFGIGAALAGLAAILLVILLRTAPLTTAPSNGPLAAPKA